MNLIRFKKIENLNFLKRKFKGSEVFLFFTSTGGTELRSFPPTNSLSHPKLIKRNHVSKVLGSKSVCSFLGKGSLHLSCTYVFPKNAAVPLLQAPSGGFLFQSALAAGTVYDLRRLYITTLGKCGLLTSSLPYLFNGIAPHTSVNYGPYCTLLLFNLLDNFSSV